MMHRFRVVVVVLCLMGPRMTHAAVVYVSKVGNDANSGLSWAAAKLTVQAGLNASSSGDEVWVAAGTYLERITLKAGVALYGGFAEMETELSERDWVANAAVLDGQAGGSVVTSPSGATSNTRIDGFTIRNGSATYGGGIYCSASSPTIANNTIMGNSATYEGGGISCEFSSPTITNNTIAGNTTTSGGGIYCYSSSPTIANNTIAANGVRGGGGGIHCSHSSSPAITNNTIAGGGKGIHCDDSSPTIVNTIVAFNLSGIFNTGTGTPVLRDNCVFGNTAFNYSGLTDPTGTNGNISTDPKLVDTAHGNVHVQPDSPCRDAGDDAVVQSGWLDIDSEARIQGSHVDIGADESEGSAWPEGPYVIVRVSSGGDDANDGSSWALAKRTVQAGVNAASAAGGEVWVKSGTYLERITLLPYAYLYGGFAGSETMRDQRDFNANVTILDGQAGGSVVTVKAGHRVSTIDGFAIRNGSSSLGGGIYCSNSSPTIANNMITGNRATDGGGIHCSISSPMIVNNTITGNKATGDCGGIFCLALSPTITNNTIAGNTAGRYGGGIGCWDSSPTITNNSIAGNTAYQKGGGIACDHSSPILANNTITENSAAYGDSSTQGGGIYCYYSSPMIVNNTIRGNRANHDGGGIFCSYSSPTISNTIVAFNHSGIYKGAAGTPVLRYNCVFGNTAYNFSGLADPTGTDGNISADPRLADAAYGNVHIQPDSPCREVGDDAVVQMGWLDIDGETRIRGSHVDIGADESDGTNWPAGPYVIVRISPEGDDAHDGSAWALAKRTVQAGINAAAAAGGEAWVRAGTYPERITLHPYAHVYGGFAGTEIQRDQRAWAANPTILDGQAGGSVITIIAGHRASTIDGFVVRNGSASYGGGVYCSGSSPTISNCTITGNIALGSYVGYGGGIYCICSSPTIANNTITGNIASGSPDAYGGGIYCSWSSPVIANNMITGNSGDGIWIYCYRFIGDGNSSPAIANNTITGNSRVGIYCDDSSPTIAKNAIAGNSGGGIYCFSNSSPTIANNTITGNTATSLGGGISCSTFSSPTIINCAIAGNNSPTAGAFYCSRSSPTIANTIIAFNSSGIYKTSTGTPVLRYNCVFGNTTYNFSGLTDPAGTNGNISADPLFRSASPGPDSTWGTADDVLDDLRLASASPCIDAGINADVPAGILTDLDGALRFFDDPATPDCRYAAPGMCGTAPIVDMGAYEYALTIPGDFDGDGDVDLTDFAHLQHCLGPPFLPPADPNCENANLDCDVDGDVSLGDVHVFRGCMSGAGVLADPDCAN